MAARDSQPTNEPGAERASAGDSVTTRSRRYVCRACGAFVASLTDRVVVAGTDVHERANPSGFVHRFVTLRCCECARTTSAPTTEFSWFAGHAWQVVECTGCGVHLGWRFAAIGDTATAPFYGVLLARIREG